MDMKEMEQDAKKLLEDTKKEREEMSKKPEARGAGPAQSAEKGKTKDEETKKVEAEKKAKDLEAQAKKDEEILSKKDEELDDVGKARKAELVKVKEKVDAEDKEKKEKSNVQKRIDELTGKIKYLESDKEATKAEKDALKTELDGIKKQLSMTPDDKFKVKLKEEMTKLRQKYLEDDKNLPKEERREMSKEEFDEWLLEDYETASEWQMRRSFKRIEDEKRFKYDEFTTRKAIEVMDKFGKSYDKMAVKHPELDISKRRKELEGQGKSKEDIRKTLLEENPKWKIFMEIFEADINKYIYDENGAELVVAEMEKRLDKKPEVNTEVEELKKKLAEIEIENKRLQGLDEEITSTRQAEPLSSTPELEKKREELAESMGLSKERIREAVKRRREYVR